MQDDPYSRTSPTVFMHIDLAGMRELIGDDPAAELRLAELAIAIIGRQTAKLLSAIDAADFPAVISSVHGLRSTFAALHATHALSILQAAELFSTLEDGDALKASAEQLMMENDLVCANLAVQVARLKGQGETGA
jgi:hypothetical protein